MEAAEVRGSSGGTERLVPEDICKVEGSSEQLGIYRQELRSVDFIR